MKLIPAAILLLSLNASAQQLFTISGSVRDPSGSVAGAVVRAGRPFSDPILTMITNSPQRC